MSKHYPFRIIQNTTEAVVLENLAKTSLEVALYPYVSSDIDYINITKGNNHTCTIVKSDASTVSFDWGRNGCTLISDSLEILKDMACEFIQSQGIALNVNTTMQPNSCIIMYNPYFKIWEAALGYEDSPQEEYFYNEEASNQLEMIESVRSTFNQSFTKFIHSVSPIDIDRWISKADDTLDLEFNAN